MDSLSAFLDMGGYGAFVWPSFAITVAVLAGLLVASVRSARASERELAALRAEEGAAAASDETQA
ncbi:MAG: heme exporter protein CcmD [Rhodospirillales bacterium]|jgi:heme exporter protein D|nr:heme exporter protein CcmD [Rhodospirillales bacterium]|tara:strand:- start:166 stop:360 length:195 start_codon:yes stop_codon:yes gene_type:complete